MNFRHFIHVVEDPTNFLLHCKGFVRVFGSFPLHVLFRFLVTISAYSIRDGLYGLQMSRIWYLYTIKVSETSAMSWGELHGESVKVW